MSIDNNPSEWENRCGALIGEPGSGKTCALRTLADGLYPALHKVMCQHRELTHPQRKHSSESTELRR